MHLSHNSELSNTPTVSFHQQRSTVLSAMLNGTSRMAIEGGIKYTTGTFHQGRHSCYFSYSSGSKVRVCAGGQHMPHFPVLMFHKSCTFFSTLSLWLGTSQTPFFLAGDDMSSSVVFSVTVDKEKLTVGEE